MALEVKSWFTNIECQNCNEELVKMNDDTLRCGNEECEEYMTIVTDED